MKNKMPLKAGDFVICAAIIAFACGIWIHLALMQTDQTYGEIWIDGEQYRQIKLNDQTDETIELDGKKGKVVIRAEGKSIWFEDADCPDHTCIKTGKISKVGQSAVCLPNRVMLKITGSNAAEVDVVVQ